MTTTQGAIRRLELLLARTPDMECADDLRVVLADAVLSRRLLDDARAQNPVGYLCDWGNANGLQRVAFYYGEPGSGSADDWNEMPKVHHNLPLYAAAPVPAQPAVKVGDSFFESWYSLYNPEGKSTKQTMREAYEAGLIDHEGRADWQPAAVPEAVAKASKLLRAHNEWRRGADNTAAYTAAGLGNAIDTVCTHIEDVLAMVSTQIIPADVVNDAARYQWLKQRSPFGNRAPHIEQYPFQSGLDKVKLPHFTVVGIDDAIDAAILSAADDEVKNG